MKAGPLDGALGKEVGQRAKLVCQTGRRYGKHAACFSWVTEDGKVCTPGRKPDMLKIRFHYSLNHLFDS